jgi:hypothetical protein
VAWAFPFSSVVDVSMGFPLAVITAVTWITLNGQESKPNLQGTDPGHGKALGLEADSERRPTGADEGSRLKIRAQEG